MPFFSSGRFSRVRTKKQRGTLRRHRFRTFRLEALEARRLLATFLVENVNNSGDGSLRQAIFDANELAGPDFIQFNIPGGGVQTITPNFFLPDITDPVNINATTQPGWTPKTPMIVLDGSLAGATNGLLFQVGGNTVQGLVIHSFQFDGIVLTEPESPTPSRGNTIQLNFLGTDATGTVAKPNRVGLHLVGSPNNVVSQNLISGNTESGIEIDFAASTGNVLTANWIGTDITGKAPLGNGSNGVALVAPDVPFLRQGSDDPRGYASGNTIGGSTEGAGNVISGNRQAGVHIFRGSNNVVFGNFIGVADDGKTPLPNGTDDATALFGNDGIWIEEGFGNFIGQPAENRGNLISANTGHGIRISAARKSANDNTIQFNLIGTDVEGNFKEGLGNHLSGIEIRNESADSATNVEVTRNVIGGADEDDGFIDGINLAGNTIAGNQGDGIHIVGHRMRQNRIWGNHIGINFAGTARAANGREGILLNSFDNQTPGDSMTIIGGTRALEGNLISGNVGNGIVIGRGTSANVAQNIIGLDKDAQTKIGNGLDGIFIGLSSLNIIGGVANDKGGIDISGNIIGGNAGNGVTIFDGSSGNTLLDNLIGQNADGKPLGNGQNGVLIIESPNTTIGGLKREEGNFIAHNVNAGVRLRGANSHGTKIIGNTINNNSNFAVNVQQTDDTLVKSNIIFANAAGVGFANSTSVVVTDNIIGTDADGTPDIGNLGPGVVVENSPGAVIGADSFEAGGNLISGHGGTSLFGAGVLVRGSQSTDVKILGNRIGTDFEGANPLGNEDGIVIIDSGDGAPSKTIVRGNVIAGNRVSGVTLANGTFGNTVTGNFIGTNAEVAELGNVTGVLIQDAPNNTIGGSDIASRNTIIFNHDGVMILNSKATGNTVASNVITANTVFGVFVQDTSGTMIIDNRISANARGIGILKSAGTNIISNFIGTNGAGDEAVPNTEVGIIIDGSPDTVIGADTYAGGGNLISGNGGAGIELRGGETTDTTIIGNRIGSDDTGTKPLRNRHGILIIASPTLGGAPSGTTVSNNLIAANERNGITISGGASNNTIGGETAAAGNQIQQNGLAGVAVESTAGTGNAILSNIIFANGGLGIDLGETGVTPNDGRKDTDNGPNNLQNFPELTLATRDGSHRVAGTLQSTANTSFIVQIFETDMKDPSGHGEGERLLATTTVRTNASGIGFFDVEVPELDSGTSVTATATDANNNTSEFARCITAATDTDEDGIPDVMEDAASNGGDGNVDGTPDRDQRTVASFPSAGKGAPVTLAIETPGAGFENVRPLINPSPDDAPAGAFFGLSFFNFTIFGIEPGQDVVVDVTLPPAMNPKSYFRYGPLPGNTSPVWYNWVFDGTTGAEISGNHVKLHFIDGDRGDDDLEENGTIVDPGAPGYDPPLLVTNTNDSGAGSLRQAIVDANSHAGFDFINFDIGQGVATIAPLSNLPTITDAVFIDGNSQPGFIDKPIIELSGQSIVNGTGLIVNAGASIIRGLVINRFTTSGISITSQDFSLSTLGSIEGNFIGTDVTGMLPLGNEIGISMSNGTRVRIGGTTPETRNVISGNLTDGIHVFGGGFQQIVGNYIGVAADGISPLANEGNGIRADGIAFALTIGGLAPNLGNLIAFNEKNGVASLAVNRQTGILSNSIHSNGLLGIGRSETSNVVLNDLGTADGTGTNVQNYPVLFAAQSTAGQTTIQGYLNSRPNQAFTLQFFSNASIDTTGYGEGRTFLASSSVTTSPSGRVDFTVSLPVGMTNGTVITATATSSSNNTSEFSRRLAVGEVLASVITVNSPDDVDDGVADATHTSLREAIHAANNFPGPNELRFSIGSGVQRILPLSPLPAIVEAVTIDGTTQPGFAGSPIVELQGPRSGLVVNASNTIIRGLAIGGAIGPGIDVFTIGAETTFSHVVIEGNFVGSDVTGLQARPNSGGIVVRNGANHRIGGTTPGARNVISANRENGILVTAGDGHRVEGNFIGVGSDGVTPLGNAINGVGIALNGVSSVTRATIGGSQPAAGNVIAFNGLNGIQSRVAMSGNAILSNSIHSNALLGIVYNFQNLVVLNERATNPDSDPRPIPFPVVSSADSADGTTTISGYFNGTPNSAYLVQFFHSSAVDASGFGEGEVFLGSTSVTTNAAGHIDFTVTFPLAVADRRLITATATDSANNTSQFSRRQAVGEVHTGVFIVNTTDDVDDGTADATHTSLREAIHAANNHPGPSEIRFAIGGGGVQTIAPLAPLPVIVESVLIDGTTQPDFAGTPIIELTGTQMNSEERNRLAANEFFSTGLALRANDSTIRGLVINRIAPIVVFGDSNVLEGNYIGTNVAGTAAAGNSGSVTILGGGNRVGGTTTPQRNVISGSRGVGLSIRGAGNVVQGNFIGTNAAGTVAIANLGGGASILGTTTQGNQVGGDTPGAGNVISGNVGDGLLITGPQSTVRGNFIGTDVTGTSRLANSGNGIRMENISGVPASGITIGGLLPGQRNLISGNRNGIFVDNFSPNNEIQGNFIGTDVTGTVDLGNTLDGVVLKAEPNLVGGTAAGAGNLISGNDRFGVLVASGSVSGARIQGNRIGTRADGVTALGNGSDGVAFANDELGGTSGAGPLDVLVGGTADGAGNTIAFNGGHGVGVLAGRRIAILSNSIHSNAQLGIDLNGNGVTPNDSGDADTGDNNLQNFPVLTDAITDGTRTSISGTFNSLANTTFFLQFFSNTAADPAGFGEGQAILGVTSVTSDAGGNASFTVVLNRAVPAGQFITATATDPSSNTSEFSLAIQAIPGTIQANQPPVAHAGGPYTIDEGSALALDASMSSDPDADSLAYFWDINGDGTFGDAAGAAPALTWQQLQHLEIVDGPSSFNVSVRVDDGRGHVVTSNPIMLTVLNVGPTVDAGPDQTVQEGDLVTLVGTFTDPGSADTHTAEVFWSDGRRTAGIIAEANGSGTVTATHVYSDNGSYIVLVSVMDNAGAIGMAEATAMISNIAPSASISGPNTGNAADSIKFTFSASDPSITDMQSDFTYEIDWDGDATVDQVAVGSASGLELEHTYQISGQYTISATATDKDGGTGPAAQHVLTVTEGGGVYIGGYVYLDVNNNGIKDAPELGLPNVPITLTGHSTRTVLTDANGWYEFIELPPGMYSIHETQPAAFIDGKETAGDLVYGYVGNDTFSDMPLASSDVASQYNFGERGLIAELISKRLLLASSPNGQELLAMIIAQGGNGWFTFTADADGEFSVHVDESIGRTQLELYTNEFLPLALSRGEHHLAASVSEGEQYVLYIAGDTSGETIQASLAIEPDSNGDDFGDYQLDVNSDGWVSPLDVLLVINQLNVGGATEILFEGQTFALDVNKDGYLSPVDALILINHLNHGEVGEGEGSTGDPFAANGAPGAGDAGFMDTKFDVMDAQTDAALSSMYSEPPKKLRIDTVRRRETHAMDAHIRDLSYTVGAAANRLVDDLFAQWESDPLPDHRIGVHRNHEKPWDLLTPAIARR